MKSPKLSSKLFVTLEIQKPKRLENKWELLKYLFSNYLLEDNQFHYFFEPELIIRLSSSKVLKNIKNYLDKKSIKYFEYEYPYPKNSALYGEYIKFKSIHPILMDLYHLHAIASLTLNKKEMDFYTNRTIHTLFNMRGLNYLDEVIETTKYAYNYALIHKKYD